MIVAGLRAGHYLCFFGMHVLTAGVMDLLEREAGSGDGRASLSKVRYLALEESNRRYDVGVRYGLLTAQMALALAGRDRQDGRPRRSAIVRWTTCRTGLASAR